MWVESKLASKIITGWKKDSRRDKKTAKDHIYTYHAERGMCCIHIHFFADLGNKNERLHSQMYPLAS